MSADDFDRYADAQEYAADMARDRMKNAHQWLHHPDYPVEECEFCIAEIEAEKEKEKE